MPSATYPAALNIAIIGSGPSGLAAAIALSPLPNVSVRLYEQAPELKEVGAGLGINCNAWNALELLGAADGIKVASTSASLQRNGYTSEIVDPGLPPNRDNSSRHGPIRIPRTRLQAALAAQVPDGIIEFNKKLLFLEDLDKGGVRLRFQDGTETTADLVAAGDGIRSLVRQIIFPGYKIGYTGHTGWRVLVPASSLSHIRDLPLTPTWWHGVGGFIFICPLDDVSELESVEISCRSFQEPEVPGQTVSWAVPVSREKVLSRFKITGWDKVILIGDSSHPLSGAFGAGAAFAMEDGWILARAIEYSCSSPTPVADALRVFNSIRAPYYLRMYQFFDSQKAGIQKIRDSTVDDFGDSLRSRMSTVGLAGRQGGPFLDWVYKNNIREDWEDYLISKT